MNSIDKLNLISEVEDSAFSNELKEALLESLDEENFKYYTTAKEAVEAALGEDE